MKRIISIIGIAILGITLIISCARKPEEVRIGYIRHVANLPFFVAIENGYFKQEGLEIKPIECGLKELLDALITDKVDVIPPMTFPQLLSIEVESPGLIKIFMIGGEKEGEDINSGILIRKGDPIKSIEDLKGKTMGVTSPTSALNLEMTLSAVGLKSEKDYNVLTISQNVATTSLASRKINALWLTEPELTIAMAKADAQLLIGNPRSKYILNPYVAGAGAVKAEYLKKHDKRMKKIMQAFDKAIDFIRTNPVESKKMLTKYTSLTPDLAEKVGVYFYVKSTEPIDMENLKKSIELLYAYKIIKKPVNIASMLITY